MNITNPTTFGSPALVYSTSNSSGTGGALRSNDTLAIFSSTVPTTIGYSASAATGDNAFASREDHVHGMSADPILVSKIVTATRLGSAGAGDQTIEGFGFQPTTVHLMLGATTRTPHGSYGWGDDEEDDRAWAVVEADSNFLMDTSHIVNMDPGAGGNIQYGTLKEYTDDGLIITWVTYGSGVNVTFFIMGMK